jgi:hypothetical protein
VRRRSSTIGNFWVDLTRSTTRVLLPISIVGALVLASQGVIQNLGGLTEANTLEGATQLIPGGPAASQAVTEPARQQLLRADELQLQPLDVTRHEPVHLTAFAVVPQHTRFDTWALHIVQRERGRPASS